MRTASVVFVVSALLTFGCGSSDNGGDGGGGGTAGTGGTGGEAASGGTGRQTISISDVLATPRVLVRRFVKDATRRDAVCNDGTEAVYYFGSGSDDGQGRWIIHLEGGGGCGNPDACIERARDRPELTSSTSYIGAWALNGLFAADSDLNPDFFDWNAVQIKYCSSDGWRGSKAATEEEGGFHFRGHDIIRAVLEDLQDAVDFGTDNLTNATAVILAGSSAGGVGVKHNLDRVAEMLPWADVRGLDDSAFYSPEAMGLPPPEASDYSDRVAYQGLVFDDSCAANEPQPDICAEAMTVALNHVTTPYFVVMDQSDPLVLEAAVDQTPERIDAIAASVRRLIRDRGAGFAPRHDKHVWIHDPLSYQYEIDSTSALESFGNSYFERAGPAVVVQEP